MPTDLTLFTSPKPFTNAHIDVIQRNAIASWKRLGSNVQVVVLGDEAGTAQVARELGVLHIPDVKRNSYGTPLLSSMFSQAQQVSPSPLYAFLNADILVFDDFMATAQQLLGLEKSFLAVGQRWDLDVESLIQFTPGWQQAILKDCDARGRLHSPTGSDYFIFPQGCFAVIPDFAIGRSGWDNWMFYEARSKGWKLVDTTASIRIIHQNHDYSHLPGGQPHYHLPESDENVRLAGGKRHIFLLQDVNWKYHQGRLNRPAMTWKKFWREAEIFPLVKLHSESLGKAVFAVLHPRQAYYEFRKNLKAKAK